MRHLTPHTEVRWRTTCALERAGTARALRPRAAPRRTSAPRLLVDIAFRCDAFFAHVGADRAFVGDGLLLEADSFLRYCARLDDRLLCVERFLVLAFRDVRS